VANGVNAQGGFSALSKSSSTFPSRGGGAFAKAWLHDRRPTILK
jgi:hypothetical protein